MSEEKLSRNMTAGAVASALAVAASVPMLSAMAAEAPAQPAGADAPQAVAAQVKAAPAQRVVDASASAFSWDQSTITPNSYIRTVFAPAAATLCSASSALQTTDPMDWEITVGGDVQGSFTATFEEMAKDQAVTQTMTCTCGGNPSDGRATVTAEVTGIPVAYMVSRAGAAADVNTITFICADGTEVSMPLAYVVGRHAVLSFDVNGEDLSQSMGGTNQLWLAGTAGNYFVRDVTGIQVTHEDQVPASPADDAHPNGPNVGVTAAKVS